MFPTSTDAPVYHFPFGTIGVSLLMILGYIYGAGQPIAIESLMLEFGLAIRPVQWVTNLFVPRYLTQLIFSLTFLFGVGLLTEGKIGYVRFLAIYVGIGVLLSAASQAVMLNSEVAHTSYCGVPILALMGMSLIWGPKHEIGIFYFYIIFYFIRTGVFQMQVKWYCVTYVCLQLIWWSLIGSYGTSIFLLRVLSFVLGAALATLMLKKEWVDCENWDLFSVLAGKHGREADKYTAVGSHADPTILFGHANVAVKDDQIPGDKTEQQQKPSKALQQVGSLIETGDFLTASEKLFDVQVEDPKQQLDRKNLRRLANGLVSSNATLEAELCFEEIVERWPEESDWARVSLAELQLDAERPRAALATLKQVRLRKLPERQVPQAKQIAAAAKKQIRAGVIDAEQDW